MDHPYYKEQIENILRDFKVDPDKGLSQKEVAKRLKEYGPNKLKKSATKSTFRIIIEQFLNPIIYVLVIAASLAFVFGEIVEGIAIIAVIFINSGIGFFMEFQAAKSMDALRKFAQTESVLKRDGKKITVHAEEIVPGDILMLAMGDVVPADARLISDENLAVKESALTGESVQVEKSPESLETDKVLAERSNMLYKGTMVSRGTGIAVVVSTGQDTELGHISKMTEEADQEDTPLEKKLNALSKKLIWLTLILTALIAVVGLIQGKDLLLMIETAIALAVAAIPEGLPIVATIALARGMLRLARKDVIVKKLEAVQTLGEVNVICTDKTGTLTENEMSVAKLQFSDSEINTEEPSLQFSQDTEAKLMTTIGILCNDSEKNNGEWKGDPVEVALCKLGEKANLDIGSIRKKYTERFERPFDSELKIMATVNEWEKHMMICVKGALEQILDRCTEGHKGSLNTAEWLDKGEKMAEDGLRVLAFAYKKVNKAPDRKDDFINGLTMLGIAGFLDPPRDDVKEAIETSREAGINVVMITGDHPKTAAKIAIATSVFQGEDGIVVRGEDLEKEQFKKFEDDKDLFSLKVFARVNPAQKLDIINLYQKKGFIVGMTGDGVNDAPALKKADIGIAMGVRGTEAAKEVADVILKNDSFTSIELAIRQGRVIFQNIRKFIIYLLSSNLAEILVVAIASLIYLPLPLLPLQILYLNLVTDVFPALALGLNEGEKDVMKKPPRDTQEPLMPRKYWISTIMYGVSITIAVLGIGLYAFYGLELSDEKVNNLCFYTLVGGQLLNVFNLPNRNINFFNNEVVRNPWVWGAIILCILLTAAGYFIPLLRDVLTLVSLDLYEVMLVVIASFIALGIAQLFKKIGWTT